MKFRAKIVNHVSIRNFAQLVHVLSKAGKQLVLRIGPNKFAFVLSEKEIKANGVTAWCEFAPERCFSEYIMEGMSPENNEIYLEVSSDYLASVLSGLKSSQNTAGLKIKLTKKCVACLTIEIEVQTANSTSVCVHDIPITVLPPRSWTEYQQPQMPVFSVSMSLPDVKIVRKTIERLRHISPRVIITAKPQTHGKIIFSVESMSVKSSVTYTGLRMYEIEGMDPGQIDFGTDEEPVEPRIFEVEVEMKTLFQIISADSLKATSTICSIVDGRLIHLFYIFGDATLQYCIPSINSQE